MRKTEIVRASIDWASKAVNSCLARTHRASLSEIFTDNRKWMFLILWSQIHLWNRKRKRDQKTHYRNQCHFFVSSAIAHDRSKRWFSHEQRTTLPRWSNYFDWRSVSCGLDEESSKICRELRWMFRVLDCDWPYRETSSDTDSFLKEELITSPLRKEVWTWDEKFPNHSTRGNRMMISTILHNLFSISSSIKW